MLRDVQVAALRAAMLQRLARETALELRRDHNEEKTIASLDDDDLTHAVESALARGGEFALNTDSDLRALATLVVCHGRDLDAPWVQKRLCDERVTMPADRLRLTIAESERRRRVEAHNEVQRRRFARREAES